MKNMLIKLIKAYQRIPGSFHDNCKFIPTCSNYAVEAIEVHGSIKGTYLSVKRVLKCTPWAKIRIDNVPEKRVKK